MRKFSGIFMIAAAMLTCWGIQLHAGSKKMVAPISIDEKDIVNKTAAKNANFAPLLDTIKTEFFQAGYVVVDMDDLGKVISRGGIVDAVNGNDSVDIPLDFPGYILRISVLKYGFSDLIVNRRKVVNCEVSISAHIVQMKRGAGAGQTVGSCIASAKKTVGVQGYGRTNLGQSLLEDCNIRVAKDLVHKMEQYVPAKFRPAPATVYQAKGNRVILYTPGRRILANTVLDIFDVEVIGEGDDQEIIQGDFIARVQVTKSTEKYTICNLLQYSAEIKKGMVAYPVLPAASEQPAAPVQPQVPQDNAPF